MINIETVDCLMPNDAATLRSSEYSEADLKFLALIFKPGANDLFTMRSFNS